MDYGGSELLLAHKVFTELIATEVDYVAGLEAIVTIFRQPLLQGRIISEEDAKVIFSTCSTLLAVHRSLLLALKTRLSHFSSAVNLRAPPEIGDLFLGIVSPSLETYHDFWTAREASVTRLAALLASDSAFETFHRAASIKAQSPLDKLLELPVLRVPKYEALLGELMAAASTAIKKTDAFLQLSEAFDKLVVATALVHTMVPALFEETQIAVGDIVEIFGIQIEGYNGQRGPVLTVTPNKRFEVLLNSGHVGRFKDTNLKKLPPEMGAAAAKVVSKPRGECALCRQSFTPSELSVGKADGTHVHKDECPKPKRVHIEAVDSDKRDAEDKLEIRGECVMCHQYVLTNQPRERTSEGLYKHKGICPPPPLTRLSDDNVDVLLEAAELLLNQEEKTAWQAQDAEELRQASDWGELARKRVDQFYFQLTFDMMLGIRTTVMKAERQTLHIIAETSEFRTMDRHFFPTEGSATTPPHGMADFYFKDYSPLTFRRIRARFNIDPAHYLNTICGGFQYLEFQTNSKSGEFFFFSYNREFLIKTISHNEALLLHRMLPEYYAHVMEYPDTLLTRFYGMHKVKPQAGHFVYFLIMGSVFASDLPVHSIYDLKGSKIGRSASAKDKTSASCIFKDNDFVEQGIRLHVGASKKAKLITQLKRDVTFLQSFQVMDYSLLVGIHYCDRHDEQEKHVAGDEPRLTNRAVDAGFKCDFAAVSAPVAPVARSDLKSEPDVIPSPTPPSEDYTSDEEVPSEGEDSELVPSVERMSSGKSAHRTKTHKTLPSVDENIDIGSLSSRDSFALSSAPPSPSSRGSTRSGRGSSSTSTFDSEREAHNSMNSSHSTLLAASCSSSSSSSSPLLSPSLPLASPSALDSSIIDSFSADTLPAASIPLRHSQSHPVFEFSNTAANSHESSRFSCTCGINSSGCSVSVSTLSCTVSSSSSISSSSISSSTSGSSSGDIASNRSSLTLSTSSSIAISGSACSVTSSSSSIGSTMTSRVGTQDVKRAAPPPPCSSPSSTITSSTQDNKRSAPPPPPVSSPSSSSSILQSPSTRESSGRSRFMKRDSSNIVVSSPRAGSPVSFLNSNNSSGGTHSHAVSPSGKIISRIIPEPPKRDVLVIESSTTLMPVVNPKEGLRTTKGRTAALNVSDSSMLLPSPLSQSSSGSRLAADGAIPSTQGSDRVYFIGIIDMLVNYGLRKKGETMMKSLRGHKKSDLSSVEPVAYAERIVKFLDASTE